MTKLLGGIALAASLALALPAPAAEIVRVEAEGSVAAVMNRLIVAVEAAGALVFARVDHAGAAQQIGESLPDMEVLIFGNPSVGTAAMQETVTAGLVLPLRVLAYEGADGRVWLAYQAPGEMLAEVGGSADGAPAETIAAVLAKLTAAAAEE